MNSSGEARWALDELCAEVALALSCRDGPGGYSGQASGRVRDVPDRRTIRYYTTLGLVDRPVTRGEGGGSGRTAYYGLRHLLQLVAIKRLQTQGLTLTQIQTRLLGRTNEALAEVAQIPEVGQSKGSAAPEAGPPHREEFWREPAANEVAGETEKQNAGLDVSLVGVPLAEGVTLLLKAQRALDRLDVEALRAAAAPLLHLLRTRRLVEETPKETPKSDHHERMG